MTILKEGSVLAQDQHPADALGEALGRIDALLTAMEAMFDTGRETFAVNQAYVFHSLLTLHGMVTTAQASHGQLIDSFDLNIPLGLDGGDMMADHTGSASHPVAPEVVSAPPAAKTMTGVRFVEEVTSSVANTQHSHYAPETAQWEPQQSAQPQAASDPGFAQSYLELLRKLTAAEIFAAEQQALAPPGTQQQLLPLLRSLREDFQKIHSAA